MLMEGHATASSVEGQCCPPETDVSTKREFPASTVTADQSLRGNTSVTGCCEHAHVSYHVLASEAQASKKPVYKQAPQACCRWSTAPCSDSSADKAAAVELTCCAGRRPHILAAEGHCQQHQPRHTFQHQVICWPAGKKHQRSTKSVSLMCDG